MKVRILVLVIMLAALINVGGVAQAQEPTSVVDIIIPNDQNLLLSLQEEYDVWHFEFVNEQITVTMLVNQEQKSELEKQWTLVVNQEQTSYLQQGLAIAEAEKGLTIQTYQGGYQTLAETLAEMQAWDAAYDFVLLTDWGDTWRKVEQGGLPGYDFWALEFSIEPKAGKPVAVFKCDTHAREIAVTEICMRFARWLIAGYSTDPDRTQLIQNRRIVIIPQANPDGKRIVETNGYLWRKNDHSWGSSCGTSYYDQHGVMLDGNWPVEFDGFNSFGGPCGQSWGGPYGLSEPETIAEVALLDSFWPRRTDNWRLNPANPSTNGTYLTLHSYGNEAVSYGNGNIPTPQFKPVAQKLAGFSNFAYVPVHWVHGIDTPSIHAMYGVAAYLTENGVTFFEPYANVEGIFRRSLPGLVWLTRIAKAPFITYQGPELVAGTGQGWGIVTPRNQVTISAQFGGAATIKYYLNMLDEAPEATAPAGTPATIVGSTLPHGRYTTIAQGCRSDGVCGGPYGIGFITSQPYLSVTSPKPLSTLHGPASIKFRGEVAAYGGVQSVELQFCTSQKTLQSLQTLTAAIADEGAKLSVAEIDAQATCPSWQAATVNGESWSSQNWAVPDQNSSVNALILNVKVNGSFTQVFLFGVNEDLKAIYLPIIFK